MQAVAPDLRVGRGLKHGDGGRGGGVAWLFLFGPITSAQRGQSGTGLFTSAFPEEFGDGSLADLALGDGENGHGWFRTMWKR